MAKMKKNKRSSSSKIILFSALAFVGVAIFALLGGAYYTNNSAYYKCYPRETASALQGNTGDLASFTSCYHVKYGDTGVCTYKYKSNDTNSDIVINDMELVNAPCLSEEDKMTVFYDKNGRFIK
jgi:hypothetical protein